MKSLAALLIVIFGVPTQIWAQKNSPDEKSTVIKEYDENGNLIKFDSTYVWQWNSDSTANFPFNEKFGFGKDFPGFFGEFPADSILEKFGLFGGQIPTPFDNEDFFKHFQHSFPDSMFVNSFPFDADSSFTSHFDFQFPGNFDMQELEELQKQFQEQFKKHSFTDPEFNSPEQQKEWEKLMKKQQKEKDELLKKWEGSKL